VNQAGAEVVASCPWIVLTASAADYDPIEEDHVSRGSSSPAEPRTMPELDLLIREYCTILDQERRLSERKEELRTAIAAEMARQDLRLKRTDWGSAQRIARFKLVPKRDPVLDLLSGDDLLAFATFTPARVKELLVPKYGRETLIPLFDIQKTESLIIKRPQNSGR
jgi:hypothetical protein